MITLNVTKIWAVGYNKHFMYIDINGVVYCVRISEHIYCQLKALGVPTIQSMRKKM